MKRAHIGLQVSDLERSVQFYSTLFGAPPTVLEADYAKWMCDDPRINFSISTRCGEAPGSVHFGIQVEESGELADIATRLEKAGEATIPEEGARCCYHKADKVWVIDPDAFRWETFHTTGRIVDYGETLPELEQARLDRLAANEATERASDAAEPSAKSCC